MKRQVLRLMSKAFLSWLRQEMEPRGKASLAYLEAKADLVIDALPSDGGPSEELLAALSPSGALEGLSWLLTAVSLTYPGEWGVLATESLRILLKDNIEAISSLGLPGSLDSKPIS